MEEAAEKLAAGTECEPRGLKPRTDFGVLRGAEAAALPRYFEGFGMTDSCALSGLAPVSGVKIKIKSKIKVKSSGQECPLHTGKGNSNNRTAGCRGFPLLAKDARNGAPLSEEGCDRSQNQGQGQGKGVSVPHVKVKSGASGFRGSHPFGKLRAGSFARGAKGWGTHFVPVSASRKASM